MFNNSQEVLKYIKDENVRFVDVRFIDLPGVMQHFNMPVESFTQDVFDDGLMFDGSSIRGFQAIHESDMKLVPDPADMTGERVLAATSEGVFLSSNFGQSWAFVYDGPAASGAQLQGLG